MFWNISWLQCYRMLQQRKNQTSDPFAIEGFVQIVIIVHRLKVLSPKGKNTLMSEGVHHPHQQCSPSRLQQEPGVLETRQPTGHQA